MAPPIPRGPVRPGPIAPRGPVSGSGSRSARARPGLRDAPAASAASAPSGPPGPSARQGASRPAPGLRRPASADAPSPKREEKRPAPEGSRRGAGSSPPSQPRLAAPPELPAPSAGRQDEAVTERVAEPVVKDLPRVLGRYVLLRRLARGGMGEVFLASTTGVEGAERAVVVKIIRREHATDPSFLARFLDEARVQAQLQHSGVAQVLEAALDDGPGGSGEPYAVLEYVEGKSLGDVRARALELGERLHWTEAVSIATMTAEALAHVHERRDAAGRALAIVHRDLSPQNVMLSHGGEIKVIDFGTARGLNRRCHTVSGVVFAKPGYVAPEVANGDVGDARVDLYALGVMLWEICAGRRFLQGDATDHMAAVAAGLRSPPPVAAEIGAPPALDGIIARLTAFDPAERYAAARPAASELAKLLGAAPALPEGERGVRSRAAALMQRFFPSEPLRSRREFARLVAAARELGVPGVGVRQEGPKEPGASRSSADALLAGTRYRRIRELGRGSSSVVYEAEHVDIGRRVAVKVLADPPAGEGAGASYRHAAAALRREARVMVRLSQLGTRGLVRLHDFGIAEGERPYCAMELLEGETLAASLDASGPLAWPEALGLARAALEALGAVHEAGVLHRDVKPQNLFLTPEGGVLLLDFGIALTDEEPTPTPEEAKSCLSLYGTPEYMAPEQAGLGRIDARADLYALGCVLYEMLTGRLPFVGKSGVAILDAKVKGSPERPSERARTRAIPAHVDALVMRAIARHPSVRFGSAAEMISAIDASLAEPERARRRRRKAGFVALAGAMGLAGGVLALLPGSPFGREGARPFGISSAPASPAAAENLESPSRRRGVEAPPAGAAELPSSERASDGPSVSDAPATGGEPGRGASATARPADAKRAASRSAAERGREAEGDDPRAARPSHSKRRPQGEPSRAAPPAEVASREAPAVELSPALRAPGAAEPSVAPKSPDARGAEAGADPKGAAGQGAGARGLEGDEAPELAGGHAAPRGASAPGAHEPPGPTGAEPPSQGAAGEPKERAPEERTGEQGGKDAAKRKKRKVRLAKKND